MRQNQRILLAASDAAKPFFVGVDVGGTSMKIGLVDDLGRSVHVGEVDSDGTHRSFVAIKTEADPHGATQLIAESIRTMFNRLGIKESQCCGVGFGVPGTMDQKTMCLRELPNLRGWNGFPVAIELAGNVGMPVTFSNDANAAAYGEYWVGSAAGHPSVALLTLGTGIGCGIILDGRSVNGYNGYGGECGHIIIDNSKDAMLCGCGVRGHLEAYAGALGVARRTLQLTNYHKSSIRNHITPETRLSDISRIVYNEAEKGDALAIEIIVETANYIALGITSILHTIDPACILLGGAMTFGGKKSAVGKLFLQSVTDGVEKHTFKAIADNLVIDFPVLGSDAGYIGAAGLARKEYTDNKKQSQYTK
ncbi:MAG: ROK family protein [Planctomycetaceae bacterium]|jgi:glucokinase|nr:ROK family protein [Planctomycetaceae bacterium]